MTNYTSLLDRHELVVSSLCPVGWHFYPMKHRTFMKELCDFTRCDPTNDLCTFSLMGIPRLKGDARACPRGEASPTTSPTTRRSARGSRSVRLSLLPSSMLRLIARASLRLQGVAALLHAGRKRGNHLLRRLSLTSSAIISGAFAIFKTPRSLRAVSRSYLSRFIGASPSLPFLRAGFVRPRLL